MDPHNFSTFITFLHQCIVIIFFTTLLSQTLSLDSKYEACEPKSCGNHLKISYPFWISGEQESYCGYPNFEISCNDENPILSISSDDYIIKDIFYDNSSLLLANSAAFEDSCPTPLHNLTLTRTPFNLTPVNTGLLLGYNCTEPPPDGITYPISCATNYTHYSFAAFHKEMLVNANYSLESCHSLVYAPVDLETGFDTANYWPANYTEILKRGFLLNWTVNNCSSCKASGGRCGFDNNEFVCFCQDKRHRETCGHGSVSNSPLKFVTNSPLKFVIGGVTVGSGIMIITCLIICHFRLKISAILSNAFYGKIAKNDQDIEAFIRNFGLTAPKRYRFSDIKKMTNSFKDKLGQGGYGGVYKGRLSDGQIVAVKLLNTPKGNGQEFVNEVASISRTSHVNVVTLLGFCIEGSKRALIYEFMPNGSLEKFIYNEENLKANQCLGWEKMYDIAIGIARGLEYLHRGCTMRILHLDIKPHNILLDEDFCPKISDFGLAKLCPKKESIVILSDARGTIGYIAPEVFNRNFGEISHKSDVYSYGMMILEMVGGRKNLDAGVLHSSEIYFPHWIYKHVKQGEELKWHGLSTNVENEIIKKVIIVGLWCIQIRPSDRPSMNKVIEMLRGSTEALQIPPEPFLTSPSRLQLYSSTTSMS